MKKEIRQLLIRLVLCENQVGSWGITSISILEDSISFDVTGFLYQGRVTITPTTDLYRIQMGNGGEYCANIENVVSTLDSLIEVGDNYYKSLIDWLHRGQL